VLTHPIQQWQPAREELFRRVLLMVAAQFPRDPDDIAQETALNVLRGLHTFRGDAPFCHWVQRIARNRSRRFPVPISSGIDIGEDGIEPARPPDDPLRRLLEPGCVLCMTRVVAALPHHQQWVWYRHTMSDPCPSYDQLGREVEMPRRRGTVPGNTVGVWLRGIRELIILRCAEPCGMTEMRDRLIEQIRLRGNG
jgi:hypothetical protein